jgi:hypothetical protein
MHMADQIIMRLVESFPSDADLQSQSGAQISKEHNRIRPERLRRRFAQPAKKSPTSLANSAGCSISGM